MGWLGLYPFVCLQIPVKNKQGKVVDTKYKLNPAFGRIIVVSKDTNKAVSEMLDIKDKYISYCIDEAALYIYRQLCKPEKENGNEILKSISKRK